MSNDVTTRKRIRPNLINHKIADSNSGLIGNENKDQETDQTVYKDEASTARVVEYVRNNFERVSEQNQIKTESSIVNHEIITERPERPTEETSETSSEPFSEDIIAVSVNTNPIEVANCNIVFNLF